MMAVACGDTASSSASPSSSIASSASPSARSDATLTPAPVAPTKPPAGSATLAPFEPTDRWRPVLELTSGPGGTDTGTFRVRGRYRLYQQCLGEGGVALTVATSAAESSTTRIECSPTSQPQTDRILDVRGRATVTLAVEGDPEWMFVFQVPVED